MDEIVNVSIDVFERMETIEKKWRDYVEDTCKKLRQKHVDLSLVNTTAVVLNKTPVQNKKKKRLTAAMESEEVVSGKENATPPDKSEDSSSANSQTFMRPVRTAKTKASKCLKEPSIHNKLRQPSEVKIKTEPDTSLLERKRKTSKIPEEVSNNVQSEKKSTKNNVPASRKSRDEGFAGSIGSNDNDKESRKKLDESVEFVKPAEDQIEILTDDETEKMPPPSMPVPKVRKGRTKKKVNAASSSEFIVDRQSRIRVKQEPVDDVTSCIDIETTKTKRQRGPSKKISIKKEKESISKAEIETNQKKDHDSSNSKKKQSLEESIVTVKRTTLRKINKQKTIEVHSEKPVGNNGPNNSFESVYEDAVTGEIIKVPNIIENDEKISKAEVSLTRLNAQLIKSLSINNEQSDVKGQVEIASNMNTNINDVTFVATSENKEAPPLDQPNALNTMNETFDVRKSNEKENLVNSSIMTEDNSDIEDKNRFVAPSQLPKTTINTVKKNIHEIFNPCVQSPVKKKVEAFEKHAQDIQSPVPQRMTRTKTRNRQPQESIRSEDRQITNHKEILTPLIGQKNLIIGATSNSKLAHLKKTSSNVSISTSKSLSRSNSVTRSNSVEDVKRGMNILQAFAEERKKKREEKQRLAQQQREAKEKEKREQTEKAAKEKEEKYKKFLQEKEEKARIEKKKALQARLALEAEQRQKLEEIQKSLKKHDLRQDELRKYELQKRLLKKNKPEYGFDMLCSDDSTDEEEKTSTKRPSPPEWSTSKNRSQLIDQQSYLSTKIVDTFFCLKPLTPDLKEIFPAIDPKQLKRNSSVVWNTPPRSSQLPKY